MKHLRGLERLEALNLSGCREISDAGLAYLAKLTRLREVNLSGCKSITDASLEYLKGNTELRKLHMTACSQITDTGLSHLRAFPQLEDLNLFACQQITRRGASAPLRSQAASFAGPRNVSQDHGRRTCPSPPAHPASIVESSRRPRHHGRGSWASRRIEAIETIEPELVRQWRKSNRRWTCASQEAYGAATTVSARKRQDHRRCHQGAEERPPKSEDARVGIAVPSGGTAPAVLCSANRLLPDGIKWAR